MCKRAWTISCSLVSDLQVFHCFNRSRDPQRLDCNDPPVQRTLPDIGEAAGGDRPPREIELVGDVHCVHPTPDISEAADGSARYPGGVGLVRYVPPVQRTLPDIGEAGGGARHPRGIELVGDEVRVRKVSCPVA